MISLPAYQLIIISVLLGLFLGFMLGYVYALKKIGKALARYGSMKLGKNTIFMMDDDFTEEIFDENGEPIFLKTNVDSVTMKKAEEIAEEFKKEESPPPPPQPRKG